MSDIQPKEEDLFSAALELGSAEERLSFLKEQAGDDNALRQRVLDLLEGYEQGRLLEEASPMADLSTASIAEQPGSVIDRYKLLEKIGEGGFGVVYLAEQRDPVVRKVALKIIKLGMDTKQVIARFEAERQALALMDHPNIARIIDAGATTTGRPYFVMELVTGVSITRYCEEARLGVAERLKLFIPVCQAVQHAHHKGVIHRDLKPSNVMVTLHDGVPVPKVIDFGVSKALNQRLTERTLFTNYAQMVGTPAYMSPEQAEMSGLDVDTRSDIYSLGVLLYELLTGTPPHDAKHLGSVAHGEMQRIIREEEPPLPSTRLTTSRRSSPIGPGVTMAMAEIPRDLDWIVMKALEKDRRRRYETANEFVQDVDRFLSDKPVEATAPGFFYRLGKFARRNRIVVAAGTVVIIVILVALTISTLLLFQAREANRVAEVRRLQAEEEARHGVAVTARLEEALKQLGPSVARGRPAKEILDELSEDLSRNVGEDPEVVAAMQTSLGLVYLDLWEMLPALKLLESALRTRIELLGEDHPNTLKTMIHLAYAQRWLGDVASAIKNGERAVAFYDEVLPPDHRDLLHAKRYLAGFYNADGQTARSRDLALEVVERCLKSLERGDLLTIEALNTLAIASRGTKPRELREQALKLAQEAIEMNESLAIHPVILNLRSNLASDILSLGNTEEAITRFTGVLADCERFFDESDISVVLARTNLAITYAERDGPGDLERAVELHRKTLPFYANLGKGRDEVSIDWVASQRVMGSFLVIQEKPGEAIDCYEKITAFPMPCSKYGRDWLRAGLLLAQAGHPEAYHDFCRRCLDARSGFEFGDALHAARACLIMPVDTASNLQRQVVGWAGLLANRISAQPGKPLIEGLLLQGMASYRSGDFEKAINQLQEVDDQLHKMNDQEFPDRLGQVADFRGTAFAFKAMATMRLGELEEARRLLGQARRVIEDRTGPSRWKRFQLLGEFNNGKWLPWDQDLASGLALAEAQAVIEGGGD